MPMKDGQIGIKRDRGEEGEQGPLLQGRQIVRQALEQAKAAGSYGDYQQAASACTAALDQEGLATSTSLQLLLTRSSMYRKGGNTQAALKDSRAAVSLCPESAQAYIGAAKALRSSGHLSKAKQALSNAARLNGSEQNATASVIDKLQQQWSTVNITGLAGDILMDIFSYLSTPDLCSLKVTCKSLSEFLRNNPSLWAQQVILKGSLAKASKQWRRLSKLLAHRDVHSIDLNISSAGNVQADQASFFQDLPLDNVLCFAYHGEDRSSFDRDLWQVITKRCNRLRILRFRSENCSTFIPILRPNDALAACQLEVLSLQSELLIAPDAPAAGESFWKIVERAKEIQIAVPMSYLEIKAILEAAKDSVEMLHINRPMSTFPLDVDDLLPDTTIILSKAHTVTLNWDCTQAMMNCRAPLARSLSLICGHKLNETRLQTYMQSLLNSCASNLISFELIADSKQAAAIFDNELPAFQDCKSLCIALPSGATLPRLWNTNEIDKEQTANKMKGCLFPRLHSMKIVGDTTLKGGELAAFLRSRKAASLSPVERLELINCENVGPEAVAWLRRYVPSFTIQVKRNSCQ